MAEVQAKPNADFAGVRPERPVEWTEHAISGAAGFADGLLSDMLSDQAANIQALGYGQFVYRINQDSTAYRVGWAAGFATITIASFGVGSSCGRVAKGLQTLV